MVSKVLLLNFDFQSIDSLNLFLTGNKTIFNSVIREQNNLIKNR